MSEISRRVGILAGTATPPVVESGTQLSERITGSNITDIVANVSGMGINKEFLEMFFVYLMLGLAGALGAYIFTNGIVPLWKKLCKKAGCWFKIGGNKTDKTGK